VESIHEAKTCRRSIGGRPQGATLLLPANDELLALDLRGIELDEASLSARWVTLHDEDHPLAPVDPLDLETCGKLRFHVFRRRSRPGSQGCQFPRSADGDAAVVRFQFHEPRAGVARSGDDL